MWGFPKLQNLCQAIHLMSLVEQRDFLHHAFKQPGLVQWENGGPRIKLTSGTYGTYPRPEDLEHGHVLPQ